MDETGRFRKVDRPARLSLRARRLGAAELLFDGLPQILQQVEAVGRLLRLRRTLHAALRIKTATVSAHHFNRRMAPEPVGGRTRQTDPAEYREPLDVPGRPGSFRRGHPSASSSHRRQPREQEVRKPAAAHCASALAGACLCSGARRSASSGVELDVRRPYGSPGAPVRRRDPSDARMAAQPRATDRQRSDGRNPNSHIAIEKASIGASPLLLEPANLADAGHTSRDVGLTWRRMLDNDPRPAGSPRRSNRHPRARLPISGR